MTKTLADARAALAVAIVSLIALPDNSVAVWHVEHDSKVRTVSPLESARATLKDAQRLNRAGDSTAAQASARKVLSLLASELTSPEQSSLDVWLVAARAAFLTGDDTLGAIALEALQRLAVGETANGEALEVATELRSRGLEAQLRQVRADRESFVTTWRKATSAPTPDLLASVAEGYQSGKGIPQSTPEAKVWYRKAAEAGSARAMRRLGSMAARESDFANARELFSAAAEKGDATAMYNLGVLFLQGSGVSKDARVAKLWFAKAAGKDDPDAILALASLLSASKDAPADQLEAVKWFKKLTAEDNVTALYNLGCLYLNGSDAVRNSDEAVRCFRKAADKKDPDGLFALGAMYMKGEGVKEDKDEAVSLWRQAADLHHPRAVLALKKAGVQ